MLASEDDLGPLIGEVRRGTPAVGWVLIAIALAMTGGCVWMAVEISPSALGGLLFPAMIAGVGVWGLRHRVRVHAGGIDVQDFFARRRVRFEEADTLVYRAVAMKMRGVPTGSYVWAQLRSGPRKVTFNLRSEGQQAEVFDEFRARATEAIANRALPALRAGSPFPWGRAAALHAEGLRYRPAGLLGRKAEQTVDYRGLRHHFDAGSFSILPPDADRPLFTMKCDEPNFYPGFALFQHLSS
jgi:hypothetical protein